MGQCSDTMRRLFGWGKKEPEAPAAPPPSLNEASSRIGKRVDDIEEKIKKIDAQLIPMRAQLKKNPRNVTLKSRAMTLMDQNNEIQEIMAESYGVPDDLDEDELMDELDMLEADMAEDEALGLGGTEPDYLSVKPMAVPTSGPAQPQGELDEFGLPVVQQQPAQP